MRYQTPLEARSLVLTAGEDNSVKKKKLKKSQCFHQDSFTFFNYRFGSNAIPTILAIKNPTIDNQKFSSELNTMLVIRLSSPVTNTVKVKRIATAKAAITANARLRMIYLVISLFLSRSISSKESRGSMEPTSVKRIK